jgi:hypothetical protein
MAWLGQSAVSRLALTVMVSVVSFTSGAVAAEWKAGVASMVITPDTPVWMAGYGNRIKPSEGVVEDLHVKALALEDPDGGRAVIVTADLIGLTIEFSNRVAAEITRRHRLPREALLLNTSHTHCGPEVRAMKKDFYDMDDSERPKIDAYIARLEGMYIEVIGRALADLKPADVGFTTAKPVPFSVNRRVRHLRA